MFKKITIGIPHSGKLDARFIISFMNMAMYLTEKGFTVDSEFQEGSLIPKQRTKLAEKAFKRKSDLLFIDSDMVFSSKEIDLLLETNKDIVGGLYYARRHPYHGLVYMEPDKGEESFKRIRAHEVPNDLFKCYGIGTGFLLIKYNVLEKMFDSDFVKKYGKPFNMWNMKDGDQFGEDLSFCLRAKKAGFDIWCQPKVNLGHIGDIIINREKSTQLAISDGFLYSNDIQGWMTLSELNWLYRTAKNQNSIAEIGSWKGRSTHALLSGTNGIVYAIDHFSGSNNEKEQHKEAKEKDIFQEFLNNVGKFKNLTPLKMSSNDASLLIDKVDMVFIDGGHTYEEVCNDIKLWLPKTNKIICGHDYNWDSVNRAVEDSLGRVRNYESIWYKEL